MGAGSLFWLMTALLFFTLCLSPGSCILQHESQGESDESSGLPTRIHDLLLRRILNMPVEATQPNKLQKRMCYLNGGLAHGCDYKDLMGALAENNYWDSFRSPGRKRRQASSYRRQEEPLLF